MSPMDILHRNRVADRLSTDGWLKIARLISWLSIGPFTLPASTVTVDVREEVLACL